MAKWIGVYQAGDDPWGEEIRVAVVGTEYGFVGVSEYGEELDLMPVDTEEEARDDLEYYFAGYDTFRWLDEEE